MATTVPFALYNPALLPPETLLAEFTARRPLLDNLLDVIRQNKKGQPPQHLLLVGTRGMGKTTTLWAIAHSVSRDTELHREWQPVVFDEESRRVGDLADFWLEALRQWEYATKDTDNRADKLLDHPTPDIENQARDAFLGAVEKSGRRVILLIDNLNEVLANIRDAEPLHRLRAFLMADSRVMIIGGASRYFEEITAVEQPFYDFFRIFELRPLSLEEMKACLLVLAEKRGNKSVQQTLEERSGTVTALHLLTGGNPRLIKTFYRLLADGLQGDIRTDLEALLDEFTPYFKSIIDALPSQQQRVFDAVALAWDPVEVADVARTTRLPSNQVSAQLRTLHKAGLIAEPAGQPKRKTYLVADRFSNIHYLMRHGRAARNRFDWFVALVRLLFPDKEHAETLAKVARQTAECGPDGERDAKDLLYSAMSRADTEESCQELLHATFRESWNNATLASLSKWLDVEEARTHVPEIDIIAFFGAMPTQLRKKLDYKPENARWWYSLTKSLRQEKAWELAVRACLKAIELDDTFAIPYNDLGLLLSDNLGRYQEAENAYRKAIELNPNFAAPWNNLGILLKDRFARYEDAENAYRKAIELDPKYGYPWNNLGLLLRDRLGRFDEAASAFRKAAEVDPTYAAPWNNLGTLLKDRFARHEDAESAYRKAIEINPKYSHPWNNLGNLLKDRLARYEEAESAYRKAIELDPKFAAPWNGLGNLLKERFDRHEEAESAYRKAIELDPKYAYPWNNLGILLRDRLGRFDEAANAFRKAAEVDPTYAAPWNNLGILLKDRFAQYEDAERAYRKAIEVNPKYSHPWNNLGNLLKDRLTRYEEAESAYRKAIELDPKFAYPWNGLGNLLSQRLSRYEEAENAYRKAIELDPKFAVPWTNLGNLLMDRLGRYEESESAFRKALLLDEKQSNALAGLSKVLRKIGKNTEARDCILKALEVKPEYPYAQKIFIQICSEQDDAWRKILPHLASWCTAHPKAAQVFDFTIDGFLRFARLTSPNEALQILDVLADSTPFETVRDAFIASTNREHLDRLAPERRAIALELLKRLSETKPEEQKTSGKE